MLKEFILFIKYPYTAAIIATLWLATAILMAINRGLPAIKMVIITMFVSVGLALIGFGGKSEV